MESLTRKRLSYIEASNMARVNYVADVLLHHEMISGEELEYIQAMRGTRYRARALIDHARKKGNGVCKTFMETWEDNDNHNVFCGSSAAPEVSGEILAILDDLGTEDFVGLKYFLRDIQVFGRRPIARAVLDRLTHRTQIADAIARRYNDKARAVLIILLKRIHRNDLVERISSGTRDGGQTSNQPRPFTFAEYRNAIQGNAADVRENVCHTLGDLDADTMTRFIWTLHLPSSKSECVTSVSDLVKASTEHVNHDTFIYVETVHASLCKVGRNDLAQRLEMHIARLGV